MADARYFTQFYYKPQALLVYLRLAWSHIGLLEGINPNPRILVCTGLEMLSHLLWFKGGVGTPREHLTSLKVFNVCMAFIFSLHALTMWAYHNMWDADDQYPIILGRYLQGTGNPNAATLQKWAGHGETLLDLGMVALTAIECFWMHQLVVLKMEARKQAAEASSRGLAPVENALGDAEPAVQGAPHLLAAAEEPAAAAKAAAGGSRGGAARRRKA